MADTQPVGDGLDPSAIADWLRGHPRFLAENPDLYRRLAPPVRVHGEALADHMAAMLQAERARAAAASARAESVLAAGRAAAGLTARVQDAVLALFAAGDVADCVAAEFPAILGTDAASLCGEAFLPAGLRRLPAGTVARLLGGGSVAFRDSPEDTAALHAEAAALARHDALVRVPCATPTLLALAARDPRALDPQQGSAALAFLGRAVAAALAR
jgi:uncharacterized protein YigA (DUF484 family)